MTTALVVVLAVAVGLLALLVAGLLRSHAEILRILHGLGVTEDEVLGSRPPAGGVPVRLSTAAAADVTGATPAGGAVRVGVLAAGQPTLLAFLSSGCATCGPFWDGLGRADLPLPPGDPRVVVVTKGPEQESPPAVAALTPPRATVVMSSEAYEAYGVPATPYFVLVDGPSGRVAGEGTATSWEQLAGLLGRAAADAGHVARARRRHLDRLRDTDAELTAAGIEPGDPSLYPGRPAP